jgi:MerR family transcriptional regulator, copper efflux regulator
MMLSEFARAAGLSPDTVRFYVKRGLLRPQLGRKGGSNPYQLFSAAHVDTARLIRTARSLGFTLREIAAINEEFQAKGTSRGRRVAVLRDRLGALDAKAAEIGRMTAYLRAKIAWMEAGETGPEPALERPDGEMEALACVADENTRPAAKPRALRARAKSAIAERNQGESRQPRP